MSHEESVQDLSSKVKFRMLKLPKSKDKGTVETIFLNFLFKAKREVVKSASNCFYGIIEELKSY
jgi:hypothetical protein